MESDVESQDVKPLSVYLFIIHLRVFHTLSCFCLRFCVSLAMSLSLTLPILSRPLGLIVFSFVSWNLAFILLSPPLSGAPTPCIHFFFSFSQELSCIWKFKMRRSKVEVKAVNYSLLPSCDRRSSHNSFYMRYGLRLVLYTPVAENLEASKPNVATRPHTCTTEELDCEWTADTTVGEIDAPDRHRSRLNLELY